MSVGDGTESANVKGGVATGTSVEMVMLGTGSASNSDVGLLLSEDRCGIGAAVIGSLVSSFAISAFFAISIAFWNDVPRTMGLLKVGTSPIEVSDGEDSGVYPAESTDSGESGGKANVGEEIGV